MIGLNVRVKADNIVLSAEYKGVVIDLQLIIIFLTDFLSGWNFVIANAKMPPSRISLGGFLFQKKKKTGRHQFDFYFNESGLPNVNKYFILMVRGPYSME